MGSKYLTDKITKPVTAYGFKGMSNLPGFAAKLLDKDRQISPQVVLNADVTDGGVIEARGGYRLAAALTNCHSVVGEECGLSVMLCVADLFKLKTPVMSFVLSSDPTCPLLYFYGIADGIAVGGAYNADYSVQKGVIYGPLPGFGPRVSKFCRIIGTTATELCEVTGPRVQVNYAEINNVIYASNPCWKATYDLLAGTVSSWGVSLPPAPDIALVAGDLPPGTYSLCYTNVIGDRLGGNGPLVKIKWEGGAQGILLRNLPEGAICWITHPNGDKLFLAPVTGGVVSGQSPWMKPLPSFMVQPPPGFSHFIYAFGRIWGGLGKRIYYSDPGQYEWFRPANFLPFLEDVVLVAPVTGGLFVSSLTNTWYLEGTDPAKMKSTWVGNGAIPGTLTMVQVPASVAGGAVTSELFGKFSKMPTPIWMAPTGFVVGSHGGNLTYLTENKMNIQVRTQGAGLYRLKNGIPQVILSLFGLPEGASDLDEMFTRGRIYIPAPVEVIGSGGIEISGP